MHCACTIYCYETTCEDSPCAEEAVLPPLRGVPGSGQNVAGPRAPGEGGGHLPPLRETEKVSGGEVIRDRKLMQALKPTVWIGKKGCTEGTVQEIERQLSDRKVVKIRWLKNTDIDPVALAEQTKADVVMVRGRTLVLSAKR